MDLGKSLSFGLTNAKAYGTPMSPSTKLDKDEKGKLVDVKLYRGNTYVP